MSVEPNREDAVGRRPPARDLVDENKEVAVGTLFIHR